LPFEKTKQQDGHFLFIYENHVFDLSKDAFLDLNVGVISISLMLEMCRGYGHVVPAKG
jgi:hypothetical protein